MSLQLTLLGGSAFHNIDEMDLMHTDKCMVHDTALGTWAIKAPCGDGKGICKQRLGGQASTRI